jgi:hypothetical protein
MREFDYNQFEKFQNWAKTEEKEESWFTSKNVIESCYYVIGAGLFFRGAISNAALVFIIYFN